MRYIHFYGSSGYCGTDYHELRTFDDDIEDSELNDISAELAHDNAETYSYLATGWSEEFESEEEEQEYYANAYDYCGWDEVETEEEFNDLEEMYS